MRETTMGEIGASSSIQPQVNNGYREDSTAVLQHTRYRYGKLMRGLSPPPPLLFNALLYVPLLCVSGTRKQGRVSAFLIVILIVLKTGKVQSGRF